MKPISFEKLEKLDVGIAILIWSLLVESVLVETVYLARYLYNKDKDVPEFVRILAGTNLDKPEIRINILKSVGEIALSSLDEYINAIDTFRD